MAKKQKPDNDPSSIDAEENSGENEEEDSKPIDPAYSLAAGLVWQDRYALIPWYLLLICPEWFLVSMQSPTDGMILFSQLAACTLELAFMYYVCRRWICRLGRTPRQPYNIAAFARLLLIGYAFWFLLIIPLIFSMYLHPDQRIIALLAIIPALIVTLKFYFYFFPAALHETSFKVILKQAAQFTSSDRLLPLKVLATPIGIMILASSIVGSVSPDGRDRIVLWLASCTEGLFPVLKAYLGFAIALYLLNDAEWHKQELDPYRNARLNTLELSAPAWLGTLLKPKTGLYLIVIGILVWIANQGRAVQLPPTPDLNLRVVAVGSYSSSTEEPKNLNPLAPTPDHTIKSQIRITLNLHDQQYNFRTFFPQFFNLSGESGVVIAPNPARILVDGTPLTIESLRSLAGMTQMTIELTFFTDRSVEQLTALEDLHLWYRRARLLPLNMKEAKVDKAKKKSIKTTSAERATEELLPAQ